MSLIYLVAAFALYLVWRMFQQMGAAGQQTGAARMRRWARYGLASTAIVAGAGLLVFKRSPAGLAMLILGLVLIGIGVRGRQRDGRAARPAPMRQAALTRAEAADILGITPNASRAEIGAAHRRLMLRLHPDQGGSDWLAERINSARDRLLRRD